MLTGTYTPTPLESSAKRAGPSRSHVATPTNIEAKPLIANVSAQTPSQKTPGRVNSVIAQNVRDGFQVGGAEGEHQDQLKQDSAARTEAQRNINILK